MIPHDAEGYAVDVVHHVVHTRYAKHGTNLERTRTPAGVAVLLGGAEPHVCRQCFPTYRKPRVRKRP